MEYLNVFKSLNDRKVRYLLCGGLAVNIYGIPRMTADIDLLLDFEEHNIAAFEETVAYLKYVKRLPVPIKTFLKEEERKKAIKEKNLVAYSYFNAASGFMELDVLLDVPLPFEKLWLEKETRNLNGTEINLVNMKDLIALKNYANRIQDRQDVLLLSKLINENRA